MERKVKHVTEVDSVTISEAIIICHPDHVLDYQRINHTTALTRCESLAAALETAERIMDHMDTVIIILDDILKFRCGSDITERNALIKPFLQYCLLNDATVFLKSEHISDSLQALIEKVFS